MRILMAIVALLAGVAVADAKQPKNCAERVSENGGAVLLLHTKGKTVKFALAASMGTGIDIVSWGPMEGDPSDINGWAFDDGNAIEWRGRTYHYCP